jgi:hypothetical protein
MVLVMRVIGKMICKKDMDRRYGVIMRDILVIIRKEKNMDMEFITG